MSGSDRVEVPVIPPGHAYTHEIAVQVRRPGKFTLTSPNFSYRNEFDVPVRVTDFSADLVARSAPAPVPVRQPAGRLRVWCDNRELDLDAWDELTILVSNETGVALHDVTVALRGPVASDDRQRRIAVLKESATARFTLAVRATERGRHVPVVVTTRYGHLDQSGATRTVMQEDVLDVAVRPAEPSQPAAPVTQPALTEQTVLYLAASPRDLAPLRSDLEMRKVQQLLPLGRARDRFRIEHCPAVRFDDLSQALISYDPQVVHFSGHGDRDGSLYLENDLGEQDSIAPEGLAALFGQHTPTLRCVIVNACHSVRLAEAVSRHIEYVVGMRYEILDKAAIHFSKGFYEALFAGWTVPRAFARGCAHIRARPAMEGQHRTPLLFSRGADPQSC
ncbi:CHAT domain-containing protein [Micromonospora sp. NBC_01813]|uniref:CHAT domain-containing protein n=1 Tax=Micromonospora sp. NBC_01813 TaxID=2975988 RepID=UPI002DD7F029|nr:CHAT domain-containing protein [Micromonospora sp. NBC_01813]WSA08549.1 CHAT domain-containing protein [Micromonospora sp. NBC_01813]